jgi:hypothetical protein
MNKPRTANGRGTSLSDDTATNDGLLDLTTRFGSTCCCNDLQHDGSVSSSVFVLLLLLYEDSVLVYVCELIIAKHGAVSQFAPDSVTSNTV